MDYHKGKGKGNPSFEEDDDGTIDLTLKLGRSDQYNRIEEAANAMYGQVHNYSSAICQSYNDMGNYSYHQDVYSPSVSTTPTRKRSNPNSIKICKGCGSNDTPLWRKGPDGPQTLCNACGLRHLRTVKRAG